jgi:hypothetical protein
MSTFAICNEACPHSKALPVTKPRENPTCSDENSDSHDDQGQQELPELIAI